MQAHAQTGLSASTNASNRDDPSENEIRPKHKHKQNNQSLLPLWKLFRCKVIWIQCSHWPNITMYGKYPCTCVMPEWYLIFTCWSTNASISASTRKRKKFDPSVCACAYACVKALAFYDEIRIIVFAFVFALMLMSLVKTRLKQNRSDNTNELTIIYKHTSPSDARSGY